jgi:phosphoglycerol transferase MdoB-like AlkP superfamily enzyme
MDIYVVNGLPLHVLLVHAVVILVPLTALCVVLAAVWPAVRRRIGIVNALLGLVLIGLIPLTTMAGQWLKDRVPTTPLIAQHAALGMTLWPWTLSLGILGIVTWLWYFITDRRDRRRTTGGTARRVVAVIIALAAIGIGGFATWQTIQVGEAGSRAIWQNSFSETPAP